MNSFLFIADNVAMHMSFEFSINDSPTASLCGTEAATVFSWDENRERWAARNEKGHVWYLHFNREGNFLFSSNKMWFYRNGDANLYFGDFSAGDSLLVPDKGCLYDPSRPSNGYIAFYKDKIAITGFSYSDYESSSGVSFFSHGNPTIVWTFEGMITLTKPTAIPPYSAANRLDVPSTSEAEHESAVVSSESEVVVVDDLDTEIVGAY